MQVQRQQVLMGWRNSPLLAAGLISAGLAIVGVSQPAQAFSIYQTQAGLGNVRTGTTTVVPTAVDTTRNSFLTEANSLGVTQQEGFENTAASLFYNGGSGSWKRTPTSNLTITVTNGGAAPTNGSPTNGIVAESTNGTFGSTNNLTQANTQAFGFNTTAGGSNLLRISPNTNTRTQTSITFSFTTGVRAFGIFLTDYGNTSQTTPTLKAFVNGSSTQTGSNFTRYQENGNSTYRSVQFFGITQQSGNPLINSVTFRLNGVTSTDRFGFDDVYSTRAAVPVPPQVLGSALFAGLAFWKKKKRQVSTSA
jgi:hypothetical protein